MEASWTPKVVQQLAQEGPNLRVIDLTKKVLPRITRTQRLFLKNVLRGTLLPDLNRPSRWYWKTLIGLDPERRQALCDTIDQVDLELSH